MTSFFEKFKRTVFSIPPPRHGEGPEWRPFVIPEFRTSDERMGLYYPPIYKRYFTGRLNTVWKYGYEPALGHLGRARNPTWNNLNRFERIREEYFDPEIGIIWVNRPPPTGTPPADVEAAWAGRIADQTRHVLERIDEEVRRGKMGSDIRSMREIATAAVERKVAENLSVAAAGAAERAATNSRAEATRMSQAANQAQPSTRRRKNRRHKTRRN